MAIISTGRKVLIIVNRKLQTWRQGVCKLLSRDGALHAYTRVSESLQLLWRFVSAATPVLFGGWQYYT
jgi:hypothetical protein